jgi:Ca-activated chloride channel homolog
MSFASPLFFLLLLLVPLLIFFHFKKNKTSGLQLSLANGNRFKTSILDTLTYHFPFILRILAIILIIIALARPQFGQSMISEKNLGLDIILLIDTSQSMSALDFKIEEDTVDRLTVLKKIVSEFIISRTNDRLGLIVFGDEAYTQCPITRDHGAVLDLVRQLYIGAAGNATAIGSAIALGVKRLKDLDAKSKVLILMTDGQNTAGSISPLMATELAKKYHIKIYTVGIGQEGEVPFLIKTPYGDKLIKQNVTIDEATLTEIAESTAAKYFRAKSTEELTAIYDEINKLEKTEREVKQYHNYQDKYEYFLWAAFLIFILELGLANTVLKRF